MDVHIMWILLKNNVHNEVEGRWILELTYANEPTEIGL
jgi:hypothetical protein